MLHRLMAWINPKPAHFPQPEDILANIHFDDSGYDADTRRKLKAD